MLTGARDHGEALPDQAPRAAPSTQRMMPSVPVSQRKPSTASASLLAAGLIGKSRVAFERLRCAQPVRESVIAWRPADRWRQRLAVAATTLVSSTKCWVRKR